MKNILKIELLIIIIIILFSDLNKLQSQETITNDSTASKQKNDKGFTLYAVGGIGVTTGSVVSWEDDFKLGPISSLGLELPFTSAHIVSLELHGHYWVSQVKNYYRDNFKHLIKISDNSYSQYGISAMLKLYTFGRGTKLRFAFFLGRMFLSQSRQYCNAFEIGIEVHYLFNDDWSIDLSRHIIFGEGSISVGGPSNSDNPNYLLLNSRYKINW